MTNAETKLTLAVYLQRRGAVKALTRIEAEAFGLAYPQPKGWARQHGSIEITAAMIEDLKARIASAKPSTASKAQRGLDGIADIEMIHTAPVDQDQQQTAASCAPQKLRLITAPASGDQLCDAEQYLDQLSAIRRTRLLVLVRDLADGNVDEFAEKYGYTRSQIYQLLSETYNNGRSIGERAARTVEHRTGTAFGWLDRSIVTPAYALGAPAAERQPALTTRAVTEIALRMISERTAAAMSTTEADLSFHAGEMRGIASITSAITSLLTTSRAGSSSVEQQQ